LVQAGEFSEPSLAVIAMHALVEFVSGQEVEELCENVSARVHEPTLDASRSKENGSNLGPN
jgi:hypothetical protein